MIVFAVLFSVGFAVYSTYHGDYYLAVIHTAMSDLYMRYLKPQIQHLTPEEKDLVTNGCGSESFRPIESDHYFCDCEHHDFEFARGGFIISWAMSNVWLLFRNIVTTFRQRYTRPWQIPAFLCVNVIYFLALMVASWVNFSFSWPFSWHSKDVVLDRAQMRAMSPPQNPKASLNELVRALINRLRNRR